MPDHVAAAPEADLLAVSEGFVVFAGTFPAGPITRRDLVAAHRRMRTDLHAAGIFVYEIVPSSERARVVWETLTLADFAQYAAESYSAAADRFDELADEEPDPAAAEEWRGLARGHRRQAVLRREDALAKRSILGPSPGPVPRVHRQRRLGAPRSRRAGSRRRARAPGRRSPERPRLARRRA
jgi:hypothetical protein